MGTKCVHYSNKYFYVGLYNAESFSSVGQEVASDPETLLFVWTRMWEGSDEMACSSVGSEGIVIQYVYTVCCLVVCYGFVAEGGSSQKRKMTVTNCIFVRGIA